MARKATETGRGKPTGNPSLLIEAVDLRLRHKKHEEALLWSDSPDPALGGLANEQARDARANTIQADIELYLTADTAVGTTLLKKLRLSEAVKSRIAQLVNFVAPTVRAGRLYRPGDFAQHYFAAPEVGRHDAFVAASWGLIEFLSAAESINADRLLPNVSGILRHALEQMDEQDRKKTIAGLMAYIGELQTAGVLEATPSDRLARVAMLIGEAAALVKAKVPASTSTLLFEHRQADPKTGEKCTAIEWYNTHWRERVEAGDVFANDIKHSDLKLYQAIASHQRRAGKTLSELIPVRVPRNQFDDTPEGQVARAKHLREQNARNVRRYRQRKSAKPS